MDLAARLGDAGFTPGAKHFLPLFAVLEAGGDQADLAEKALARAGEAVVEPVRRRLVDAPSPLRARLAVVLGRVAAGGSASAVDLVTGLLGDDDWRTRRAAARAFAKIRGEGVEARLVERWSSEPQVEVRRSLAESMGRAGAEASLRALSATTPPTDPELARLLANAITTLTREGSRETPSAIAGDVSPAAPALLVFHVRRGLEPVLVEELAAWGARNVAPGVVTATLNGPLSSVHVARTWLSFGFRIAPVPVRGEVADAVASAISSRAAREIFRRFTVGTVRFRLAFSDAAHHRALSWAIASAVRERAPELVNDPTSSTWEVTVVEHEKTARIELSPRALEDPRFAYRRGDVPAASHPTIAAALARIAGPRENDVVWDPFCGSGLELIERARLGGCKALVGTDVDTRAIETARQNVASAGVTARIAKGDAREYRVPGVSLIITNPPMGRRVSNKAELGPLLDDALASWAAQLVPGGRIVWISPMAGTARRAEKLGLRVTERRDVDMGGFTAQLQKLEKP
jgi:23S rRNA G2445 N2-methylase RlmL